MKLKLFFYPRSLPATQWSHKNPKIVLKCSRGYDTKYFTGLWSKLEFNIWEIIYLLVFIITLS